MFIQMDLKLNSNFNTIIATTMCGGVLGVLDNQGGFEMEYEIVKGYDSREYAKFKDEYSLDDYCVHYGITPVYFCCDGYMNAILLDDVVAA